MTLKDTYRQWCKRLGLLTLRRKYRRRQSLRRLIAERLEQRTVFASSFYETTLFPIANDQDPFGSAQPNMHTAAIHGLHQLLLGRDASDDEFSAMRNKLRSQASIGSIIETMLTSDEYRGKVVDQIFGDVLGRKPTTGETKWWQKEMKSGRTTSDDVFAAIIASPENLASHSTPGLLVDQVIGTLLDRKPNSSEEYRWNTALRYGVPVDVLVDSTVKSEEFAGRLAKGFADAFLGRNPTATEVQQWVALIQQQPIEQVLGSIVDGSEFYQQANGATAGQYGGVLANMGSKSLVSDIGLSIAYATAGPPTAEAPASVAAAAPAGLLGDSSSGDSTDSTTTSDEAGPLWLSALVFPPVDQASIQSNSAVQPTLQLPVGNLDWSQGFSFETWFQATAPGVILSKPLYETTTQKTYEAPLVWVDSEGKLAAGLFDSTPLAFSWESTPLNWSGGSGQAIGPANNLTSSVQVLDGNWHHVAFVYDPVANSQTLYLDGLLQGSRTPRFFDSFVGLQPTNIVASPIVKVNLNETPTPTQVIGGTILQSNVTSSTNLNGKNVSPYSNGATTQLYTFEIYIQNNRVLNTRIIPTTNGSTNATQVTGISYEPASPGFPASLTLSLSGNRVTLNTPLSIGVDYTIDGAGYSLLPPADAWWDPDTSPADAPDPQFQLSGPASGFWTVGGTTMAEPMSNLYPSQNYPQGFQGAIDELAIFNRVLTQVEVQQAMTEPLSNIVGGSTSQTTAVSIGSSVTLTAASAAPTLTATPLNPSYKAGGAAAVLYSSASIGLTGVTSLKAITLTVGGLQYSSDDLLRIDGDSIAMIDSTTATTTANGYAVSVSVSAGTAATVTISKAGGFSVSDAETLLEGLAYLNASTEPLGFNRTVMLTAIQDTGGTVGGRVDTRAVSIGSTVTLAIVGNTPKLTATAANPNFTAGGAAVNLFSGAQIGLPDATDQVYSLVLTVAGLQNGADELLVVDGTAIALSDGNSVITGANSYGVSVSVAAGTATVTISNGAGFSVAAAQTLVSALAYRNTSSAPLGVNRTATLTSIQDTGHPTDTALTHYFNFDDSSSATWENQTLQGIGTAVARGAIALSTSYNQNMSLPSEWADLPRLAGYQAWGLRLMAPFASPAVYVPSGTAVETIVGLAMGDQMTVSLPQNPAGQLQVTVTDTQGNEDSTYVYPGTPQTFSVPRTDTYRLTLNWTSPAGLGNVVQFNHGPGPLNSIMALAQSYTVPGVQGATTTFAYADPSLPAVNPTAGTTSSSSAAASYYPTWSDPNYFPESTLYTPADLAAAYAQLVAYSTQKYGFTDFCNLLDQSVANPATILNYLKGSYTAVFGALPTAPVDGGPFAVEATGSAPQAVYRFLYNVNLMQQSLYQLFIGDGSDTTNLRGWFSEVMATLAGQSDIPQQIAKLISQGQTTEDLPIQVPKYLADGGPGDASTPNFGHRLLHGLWHNFIFEVAGGLSLIAPELIPEKLALEKVIEGGTTVSAAQKEMTRAESKLTNSREVIFNFNELTEEERLRDEGYKKWKEPRLDKDDVSFSFYSEYLNKEMSDANRVYEDKKKVYDDNYQRFSGGAGKYFGSKKPEWGWNALGGPTWFLNGLLTTFQAPGNVLFNYWIGTTGSLDDPDGDTIRNKDDWCPDTSGLSQNNGCPTGSQSNDPGYARQGTMTSANSTYITVPLTPITTAELNYESLATMGTGIYATVQEMVSSIITMISDRRFIQSMMSNYGLLKMMEVSKPTLLSSDPNYNPQNVTQGILEDASWEHMTPATFHWEMVAPDRYPVFDGRTTTLSSYDVALPNSTLNDTFSDLFPNRVSADFNNDGILDLAVATQPNSDNLISLLFGNGDGTFTAGRSVGNALHNEIRDSQTQKCNPDTFRSFASSVQAIDLDGKNGRDLVYNIYTHSWGGICDAYSLRLAYQLSNGDGTFSNAHLVNDDLPYNAFSDDYSLDDTNLELLGTGTFSGQPGLVVLSSKYDQAYNDYNSLVDLALLTWSNGRFSAARSGDSGVKGVFPGQYGTPTKDSVEAPQGNTKPAKVLRFRTDGSAANDDQKDATKYLVTDLNNDGESELVRVEVKTDPDGGGLDTGKYQWSLSVWTVDQNKSFSQNSTYSTPQDTYTVNFQPADVSEKPDSGLILSNLVVGHFTTVDSLQIAFVLSPWMRNINHITITMPLLNVVSVSSDLKALSPSAEFDGQTYNRDFVTFISDPTRFDMTNPYYDDLSIATISRPGRAYDDLLIPKLGQGGYIYFNNGGTSGAGANYFDAGEQAIVATNDNPQVRAGGQFVVGDFDGDGAPEIVSNPQYSTSSSDKLWLFDGQVSSGLAGFVSGSGYWDAAATALSDLLGDSGLQAVVQQAVLQGGSSRNVAGFNSGIGGLPILMGRNVLGGQASQVHLPGAFLTFTPALLSQKWTANSYAPSFSSQGAYLAAWHLVDGKGNPINLDTASKLFGTPIDTVNNDPSGTGSTLIKGGVQIPPSTRLSSQGGAWYLDADPIAGSITNFSNAFFNWGRTTPGYAPASAVPDNRSGTLAGKVDYRLSFSAAADAPPSMRINQAAQAENLDGIAGSPYGSSPGIDGQGNAYDYSLLGGNDTLIYDGVAYTLGPPLGLNSMSPAAQIISVTRANYKYLDLLGAASGGNQMAQPFVLMFDDRSQVTWHIDFTDWTQATTSNANDPYETVAKSMSSYYRWNADQSQFVSTPGTRTVFRYRYELPSDKQLLSISFPNNPQVALISGKLIGYSTPPQAPVNVTGGYNLRAIYTENEDDGELTDSNGIDGQGYAYADTYLQDVVRQSPIAWQLGPTTQNQSNAWHNGATLNVTGDSATAAPRYLNLLGTGVNGSQTGNVLLTYTDGSTETWTQSFSDWLNPGDNLASGEVLEAAMQGQFRNASGNFLIDYLTNVYSYRHELPADKQLQKITLPSTDNIVVMAAAVTWGDQPYTHRAMQLPGYENYFWSKLESFDGVDFAYDQDALTNALKANHVHYQIPSKYLNMIISSGQTLDMTTRGVGDTLRLLGAGVNGNQENQEINMRFSDGTSQTWTQSFADWAQLTPYANQSIAAAMGDRIRWDGTVDYIPIYLYQYDLPIPAGKQLVELQLPNNSNVRLLDYRIEGSTNILTSAYDAYGAISISIPGGSGVDGTNHYFSSGELSSSTFWNNVNFAMGDPGQPNLIQAKGQTIGMPFGQYSYLTLLGAGVNGAQENQTIVLFYEDGSKDYWKLSVSDWAVPSDFSGQSTVVAMDHRMTSDGSVEAIPVNLYGYFRQLPGTKRLSAITLPVNSNLILAGVGVSNSAEMSDTFNIEGIASDGTEFDSGPYLDVEITTPGGTSIAVQRVGISVPETQANFTGGTFTLTYGGQTTTALDWDALTTDVQYALEALSNIGAGNVSVTKSQNSLSAQEWTLVFQGTLAGQNLSQVTINSAGVQVSSGSITTIQATDVQGGVASNAVQTLTLYSANGGTFTLTNIDQTTAPIAWNAPASDVQIALESLSNIGAGNVLVTGKAGGPWTISFQGALANQNLAALTGDLTGLTIDAGLDGKGFAYDASLLGTNFTWSGVSITPTLGDFNVANAFSQNVSVSRGKGLRLVMLGTGINGTQVDQEFRLLFSDGTEEVWTQSFSDWLTPGVLVGQTAALTMPQRIKYDGTVDATTVNLYGYLYELPSDKTLVGVLFPNNPNLLVLGLGVSSTPEGYNLGLDGAGNAYDAGLLREYLSTGDATYSLGGSDWSNAVSAAGQVVPIVDESRNARYLDLLGAAVNGAQFNQSILLTYQDGSTQVWTQSLSDWAFNARVDNQTVAAMMGGYSHWDSTKSQFVSVSGRRYLYRYRLSLPTDKLLSSITLPNTANVVMLGAQITPRDLAYQIAPTTPYNTQAMYKKNATFTANGGFDGVGNAYDYDAVQQGVSTSVNHWNLGPSNGNNAWRMNGTSLAMPAYDATRSATYLNLLGAASNGQQSATWVLNYSDGTSETWTQSLSDWYNQSGKSGEMINVAMDHRLAFNGTSQSMPAGETLNLFSYSRRLAFGKVLKSIGMPNNVNVTLIGVHVTVATDGDTAPTGAQVTPQEVDYQIAPINGYNTVAMVNSGITISATGGFDQSGNSYDFAALQQSLASSPIPWKLGTANVNNGWRLDGTTKQLNMPAYDGTASPTYLNLLGAASNGPQTVTFTLNYSDGTTENWTQSLSDWWNATQNGTASALQAGEVLRGTMDHRQTANGSAQMLPAGQTLNAYSYRHALPAGKALTSISLPTNTHVVLMGVLVTSKDAPYNAVGAVSQGTKFSSLSGFDGVGNAYDSAALQSAMTSGHLWQLEPGTLNTIAGAGQTIYMTGYAPGNSLRMLGAGVNGDQKDQAITLYFDDGSSQIWYQSFSDWVFQTSYSGQVLAGTMNRQLKYNGSLVSRTTHVYEYSIVLPEGKRLTAIKLPNNSNVRILGIALNGSNALEPFFNRSGSVDM